MLTEERDCIRRLAATKKRLFVVIRRSPEFFSCLKDFQKPENAGLIAFVPEVVRPSMTEYIRSCFDLIVFYNQEKNTFYGVENFDDVKIPDKDRFGDELLEIVRDRSKIELLLTEESSNREVARLGERLGVRCVGIQDVARLHDKELMLATVKQYGVPTARSITLDLVEPFDTESVLKVMKEAVGGYPVFIRPTAMAGGCGTATIRNRRQMKRWLEDNKGKDKTCLIEEFIVGREFLAVVCLLEDGTFEPLVLRYLEYGKSYDMHIKTGDPLLIQVDTFENVESAFPNMKSFVADAIDSLNPPRPHIFTIQGFQRRPYSDEYVFVECSYRPAGGRTNSVCHKVCGVCQETALLMSHMDPSYRPVVKSMKPNDEIYLWFPCQDGLLEKYTELPSKENISSGITAKWQKPLGELMKKATVINHQLLFMIVRNDDPNQLLMDAKWIAANWKPILKSTA
ncbi:hypothetical protein QR680_004733 [Steinernema hermaphroditum]|uniref:ATP-grasp domain-containing protein n=1 Tax=Steinernema hermaphroditum TaxID=289476 RepID=A0AA39HR36_9BILA|nr:hypothetical protein QR680_004733 [Steinernema hermaphroditum]